MKYKRNIKNEKSTFQITKEKIRETAQSEHSN